MMNEGFILINRKITEWEWYKDLNTKSLFLHCLIMANYEEKKWQGITVQRGSFISSIAQLSQQTGISTQSIRTSINHLKSTGELTSKSNNKYTIYTVLNYNLYQSPNKHPNKQLTSNQQATNKQLTTTKELKELKELNNIKEIYKEKYGEFENVLLSKEQYEKISNLNKLEYIDKLSEYMQSTGKKYKDHYATILSWIRKDKVQSKKEEVEEIIL